jgi:hypothetical protein
MNVRRLAGYAGSRTPVRNRKNPARTSLYQGANQCQTTLLLEQTAGASNVCSATRSPRELVSSASPLRQKARLNADFMVVYQLAQRPNKADNVVQQQKSFMATRPAQSTLSAVKPAHAYLCSRWLAIH